MLSEKPMADPVAYQRELCPPEILADLDRSPVPSPDRFFRVAAGLAVWTSQERGVIDADPNLLSYEREMEAQVRAIYGTQASPAPVGSLTNALAEVVRVVREWILTPRRAVLTGATGRPYYQFDCAEMTARLYPGPNPSDWKWTIQFVRGKPSGEIQMFAGETEIPVEGGFEGEYATVRFADIQPLVEKGEKLLVRAK